MERKCFCTTPKLLLWWFLFSLYKKFFTPFHGLTSYSSLLQCKSHNCSDTGLSLGWNTPWVALYFQFVKVCYIGWVEKKKKKKKRQWLFAVGCMCSWASHCTAFYCLDREMLCNSTEFLNDEIAVVVRGVVDQIFRTFN